jgi:hypothetical protein
VTVVNVVAVPNASTIILSAVVANPVGIHSVYGELDCIGHRVNFCEHNSIFAGSASNRINPIPSAFKALLSNAIRALSTKYCLLFESSCEDSISYVGPTLSSNYQATKNESAASFCWFDIIIGSLSAALPRFSLLFN